MTDRELLEQILASQQQAQSAIGNIQKDISDIRSKVDTIDSRVDAIDSRVGAIDSKVDRNYDKTIEFYASQQEHNTEVSNILQIITGELDMHTNQIAMNTAVLKCYK